MYGARTLSRIFSNTNWGSHFTINKCAYLLLEQEVNKNKILKLTDVFPRWTEINIFEDLNGADGLWLEGKINSATMHYNPITGQGDAPRGIKNNFFILSKILTKQKNPFNTLRASRRAAYLSHLIADVFNPPHHFGRYDNFMVRYMWWLIKSNWREDNIKGIKTSLSLEFYHRKFEIQMLYKMISAPFGKASINYEFIKKYQKEHENNPLFIQNIIIEQINKIYKLKIYQSFIKNGWTAHIEKQMAEQVFPMMISWTASFWLLAILESKRIAL